MKSPLSSEKKHGSVPHPTTSLLPWPLRNVPCSQLGVGMAGPSGGHGLHRTPNPRFRVAIVTCGWSSCQTLGTWWTLVKTTAPRSCMSMGLPVVNSCDPLQPDPAALRFPWPDWSEFSAALLWTSLPGVGHFSIHSCISFFHLQTFIRFCLPVPQAFQPRVPDLPRPLAQLLLHLPGSVSGTSAPQSQQLSRSHPWPLCPLILHGHLVFPYPEVPVLPLPLTVCVVLGKLV